LFPAPNERDSDESNCRKTVATPTT
jgi:hypothetical protein